jgi:hypothetical protein
LFCSKFNFSDLVERFLRNDEEQSLQIFMTNFFYFLRRSQNEDYFDFFFDSLFASSEEMGLLTFNRLSSWKFYVEELSESYFRQFKRILHIFLITQTPTKLMVETLMTSSCIITFDFLYKALLDLNCDQTKSFLSLWISSEIPSHCIESSIAASFPKNDIILYLMDKCEKITLSENCKAVLKKISESAKFDTTVWKIFIDIGTGTGYDSTSKSASLNRPSYEEIYSNIESGAPTDIAFGMYCLRQRIAENSSTKVDAKLLHSVIYCLFHEERYHSLLL